MADVGGKGITLDWLESATKRIHEEKELQLQYQKVTNLKVSVKESEQMLL